MQVYTVEFQWPKGVAPERPGPNNIQARNDVEAIEAAGHLYDGQVFATPAIGYVLRDQAGTVIELFTGKTLHG